MVRVEQTERADTCLDVLIRAEDGRVLAWAYSIETAEAIAWALNNVWKDSEGNARCSGCDT